MKAILFIYILIPLILHFADSKKKKSNRIIDGRPASIEEFPYQVSLERSGRHFCGGSIIHERIILTAAHYNSVDPNMMAVRVGTSRSEEGGTLHGVKQVRPHEEYDDSADVDTRDIALILLDNAISFNDRAQKVRLPILAPEEGAKGWVTGYGVQIQSAARSQPKNQLMAVELPVVNLESCKEKLKAYGGTIAEDMFCAGNLKGHKDACRGDSGGPFQIDGILYGAVAWGIGCGQEGLPGVYSDLHFFRGWLQRTSRKLLRGYKFPDPTNMPYFHT